jgi:hypothetical protein
MRIFLILLTFNLGICLADTWYCPPPGTVTCNAGIIDTGAGEAILSIPPQGGGFRGVPTLWGFSESVSAARGKTPPNALVSATKGARCSMRTSDYEFYQIEIAQYGICSNCQDCGFQEFGNYRTQNVQCTQIYCRYAGPGGSADTYTIRSGALLNVVDFPYVSPCVKSGDTWTCESGWSVTLDTTTAVRFAASVALPTLMPADPSIYPITTLTPNPYQVESERYWLGDACTTLGLNGGCEYPWTGNDLYNLQYDRIATCPPYTTIECDGNTNTWLDSGEFFVQSRWYVAPKSTFSGMDFADCSAVSGIPVELNVTYTLSKGSGYAATNQNPVCGYTIPVRSGFISSTILEMTPNPLMVTPATQYSQPLRSPGWAVISTTDTTATYQCGPGLTETISWMQFPGPSSLCGCGWFYGVNTLPLPLLADAPSYDCCHSDWTPIEDCSPQSLDGYIPSMCPPVTFLRCSDEGGARIFTTATLGADYQYANLQPDLNARCIIDPNNLVFTAVELHRIPVGNMGSQILDRSVLDRVTCHYKHPKDSIAGLMYFRISAVGGDAIYVGPDMDDAGWSNDVFFLSSSDGNPVDSQIYLVDASRSAPDLAWTQDLECIQSPGSVPVQCEPAPYLDAAVLRPPAGSQYSTCPDPLDIVCTDTTNPKSVTITVFGSVSGFWTCTSVTSSHSIQCDMVARTNEVRSRAVFQRNLVTGIVESWTDLYCIYTLGIVISDTDTEPASTTCTFTSTAPSARYYAPVRTWGWSPETDVDAPADSNYILTCLSAPSGETEFHVDTLCSCAFAIRAGLSPAQDPWQDCCITEGQPAVDQTGCLGSTGDVPVVNVPTPAPNPTPNPDLPRVQIPDSSSDLYWLFALILVVPTVYVLADVIDTARMQGDQK